MFKKGISIFTGFEKYPLQKNLTYLKKAKDLGYEIVFSSAHISEANSSISEIQTLVNEVNRLGLKLSLDISKPTFDKLEMPNNLYALRLDYGFSEEDLISLTNSSSYKIEINASTFSKKRFLELLEKGLNPKNIRASFNYYPKLHTGHSIWFCEEFVEFYHSLGVEVAAFIPSHNDFRPPMYEGLPTVESHRTMPLDLAIEEFKAIGVDEIIFSDAYASDDELELLSLHQKEELQINLYKYDRNDDVSYLDGSFRIRPDLNDELLRLSSKRCKGIKSKNTVIRKPFDVTIDNDGFLRYAGEINIILKELEKDERVNVIGYIDTTDVVIKKVKDGSKFSFQVKD